MVRRIIMLANVRSSFSSLQLSKGLDSSRSLFPSFTQYPFSLTSYDLDVGWVRHASLLWDGSSWANHALILAPSTLCTWALLASSLLLWIIDSSASSHMNENSSLLSSYHTTPLIPLLPLSMVDLICSKALVLLVLLLPFLSRKSSMFLVSLLTFSPLVPSLVIFSI